MRPRRSFYVSSESCLEGLRREGFGNQEARTGGGGALTHVGGRFSGDESELHLDTLLGDSLEQFDTRHVRHVPVGQNEVRRTRLDGRQRLHPVVRLQEVM